MKDNRDALEYTLWRQEVKTLIINLVLGFWLWFQSIVLTLTPNFIAKRQPKSVANDVALITGAGSGLGREIALQLARLGATIVAWDINDDGLCETARLVDQICQQRNNNNADQSTGCAQKFLKYRVDVSQRDQVYERAQQVQRDLGHQQHVSILINNAGIYHGLYLHDLSDQQIERIFNINVVSHFWTIRAFLPEMLARRSGHIVEIASMAGLAGLQKQVDYCATKFAVIGLEETLSLELASLGYSEFIKTTAICPFFFSSNLFTNFQSTLNRLMTCEYVAQETVRAIQFNKNFVILPPRGQLLYLLKVLTPRCTQMAFTNAFGGSQCVTAIKGAAASVNVINRTEKCRD
ncbi:Short-chain dehydrogenase/reductase family 16C member 6 [Fragariocoptes setiger]|uniref:Short-chain dehydrogenase/reductase family 16C member 6 n=1 Tax=Fragariocoptes setiger TaxID=1670756 RepID=A0ABQ7SC82_9ACAR|nr:Short-chain dehydrogenase/reductase family 16C member 6 [Fragariocoptes setiger]